MKLAQRSTFKKALGIVNRNTARARQDAAERAGVINSFATVAGGPLAAWNDHKRGTAEEPAKMFKTVPMNLVGGLTVAAACMFLPRRYLPGTIRGPLGSLGLGVATAGAYRATLEHFEKTDAEQG